MIYRIIMTRSSEDGLTSYSLFSQEVEVEELKAESYGVIAADCSGSVTVNDITTDVSEAETFISKLAERSVRKDELLEYIIEYLSRL